MTKGPWSNSSLIILSVNLARTSYRPTHSTLYSSSSGSVELSYGLVPCTSVPRMRKGPDKKDQALYRQPLCTLGRLSWLGQRRVQCKKPPFESSRKIPILSNFKDANCKIMSVNCSCTFFAKTRSLGLGSSSISSRSKVGKLCPRKPLHEDICHVGFVPGIWFGLVSKHLWHWDAGVLFQALQRGRIRSRNLL